ncbi:MAG: DUF2520 domain-containing protein [Bacteroidia bacterium]|nr:DUF2520 domain-containing protein [Bacteroidia bacterium]
MKKKISVLIVGAGNLGSVVYRNLKRSGSFDTKIVSKSKKLNVPVNFNPDIIWILKKDDFIPAEVKRWSKSYPKALLICSSATINVREFTQGNILTLYPLGTFRKEHAHIRLSHVPFFLEYGININKNHKVLIQRLIRGLGIKANKINYEQRLALHIAAVFGNNFVNALWGISLGLIGKNKKHLMPILLQTIENLKKFRPHETQTGPAIRRDYLTIKKHLQFLKSNDDLKKIYNAITEYLISKTN